MPYPIGHAAIGVATYVVVTRATGITGDNWWRILIFIFILSNFSDIDYCFNFILKANIHRGPTHTIYFAFFMGALVYVLGKYINVVPNLGFISCFLVLLSHPAADIIQSGLNGKNKLTLAGFFKDLFYPTINWSKEVAGVWEITAEIIKYSFRDYKIIIGSSIIVITIFLIRRFWG